jgi:hypothetical protein
MLPSSDAPELLMRTFRAHKGNYCDSGAAWWRLIGTSVRIFPAIHNPNGYKEVEPACFGSLKTASEFRQALDENRLTCPSAHLEFDVDSLQKTFDDANALGCTYVTCSVRGQ